MWVLFDDAREGGASPRLYREPSEIIVAEELGAVLPALEQVRAGLRTGRHAAGYLAYEAGHAFDPKLKGSARKGDGPLLCFGLFDCYEPPELE
ncbi:MAG TPA: aminodeoxychorismate synthase, component I, partial [Sphingomicrobium sp.]|nr:aminodeoxychorismate synthase, component I [Sphingomicrobium sp.]